MTGGPVDPRHQHPAAATTRTVEMLQVADLNARLAQRPRLTAADLGLAGVPVRADGSDLPATAVLGRLAWDGVPEFPDIHAVFAPTPSSEARLVVDLHTAALRELSRRLGLRQIWGVGSAPPPG